MESTETYERLPNLAVLIDAENISKNKIEPILYEISKFGVASVKRAYGDWSKGELQKWRKTLLQHAIIPIQHFSYSTGKNSSDFALVIDAMDLLYTGHFQGFCIVSSDGDFTRLVSRLRESGIRVYGFGEAKTPKSFVNACDRFISIQNLGDSEKEEAIVAQPLESPETRKELLELLLKAVEACADDDSWAYLADVGNYIRRVSPGFDPRTYGYKKLGQVFESLEDLFEINDRSPKDSQTKLLYIRVRD